MPASTQPHGESSSSESVSCTTLQSANTNEMSSTTMRSNVRERTKNTIMELELMTSFSKRLEDPESDFMGVSDDVKFRRANVTECVPVASSDHVAEIVGKQGAKIKSLRLRTSTYIKTPCRGDEPVFIITGRREDVMIAKQEILSAADQVSMLRARRSLHQVSANGATTPASMSNVSVTDAIAASNLLAASAAGFNLVPTLPAAVAALNNLNAAALVNAGLTNPAVNLAGVSMAALNATPALAPPAGFVAAASLQNALLSNFAAAAPTSLQQTLASNSLCTQTLPAAAQPQRSATNASAPSRTSHQQATTSQPCTASSRSSASATGTDSATNQVGSLQNSQASPSNGVTPINLATMSNSRVLSRLALASGATHNNPMAVLNALSGGLLTGLPSYMPPGFNLATAKHIAQLRVPERIVGLVVGPRGATIKQIQLKTNTYILTPSKGDRDAVFEIIGTADGCATAKQDIEDYVLSRTGMTVDQLLAQQSQVRALEAICQAAGLNVNRLVTNALANVPTSNVDLASHSLSQPFAGSQLGIAHLSDVLNATSAANPSAPLQNHLQTMGAASRTPKVANTNGPDACTTDGDVTNAIQSLLASLVARKGSDQLQQGVSDVNTNDRLRLFESGWPLEERVNQAETEAEEHNGVTNGVAASHGDFMNHSMFDAVYQDLNSLVSGLDETLADREHDAPHYSASVNHRIAHHHPETTPFGNIYGLPTSNSTLTAANKFENDVADVAVPERRSSASLKSLLAGLGLDTALYSGGPSSSGFASPSTSTTSGLGASLNGFAATSYQQRAATTNGASSASSGGSSPAFDMFNSRGALPTDNPLHTLTAMRI